MDCGYTRREGNKTLAAQTKGIHGALITGMTLLGTRVATRRQMRNAFMALSVKRFNGCKARIVV